MKRRKPRYVKAAWNPERACFEPQAKDQGENAVVEECLACAVHRGWLVIDPRKVSAEGVLSILETTQGRSWHGGFIWRNNTGGAKIGRSFVKFGLPGTPDITGISRSGQWVGFECKTAKGKVSPVQAAFHEVVTRLGGRVSVVRNYAEMARALEEAEKRIEPGVTFSLCGNPEKVLDTVEVKG